MFRNKTVVRIECEIVSFLPQIRAVCIILKQYKYVAAVQHVHIRDLHLSIFLYQISCKYETEQNKTTNIISEASHEISQLACS